MKLIQVVGLIGALLSATIGAGCGDNSRTCGAGTEDLDGVCVPSTQGSICGDGTKLDPATNTCQPDTSVCGSGTVLVHGTCQDPTAGFTVDLEEGPEPNGIDAGAIPAGDIHLHPVGDPGVVIHGCIRPVNDTPDFDDYTLTVTGPTLIKVTADGINGLAAGFVGFGDLGDPQIAGWQRFGLNVTTDMSRRQLYLPKAGTYDLVITDTRTILPVLSGGGDLPPAGDPAGNTTCYYVTIDQQTPAPTTLDLATGDSGVIGEDLKFYSGAFGEGFTSLTATITSVHAAPSLLVLDNGQLRTFVDAQTVATVSFGGIKPSDTPLVVFDYVYNYAVEPPPYNLRVGAQIAAQALSRTGAAVNATSKGQFYFNPTGNVPTPGNVNLFYFDVAAADETDGMNLTFSRPVQGVLVDQNAVLVSAFTGRTGNPTTPTTFTTYKGLLRFATPGRYYFWLFLPRDPVATAFTATSFIDVQDPLTALALGTPSAALPIDNNYNQRAVTYAHGTTEPWQQLTVGGAATGTITTAIYDSATAYNRLDTLAVTTGTTTQTTANRAPDAAPLRSFSALAAGTTVGRIVKPDPQNFFITVKPTTTTGTRTVTLDAERRLNHNYGAVAAGDVVAAVNNEPLDATHALRRYYIETAPGNRITVTVTPNTATLDAVIAQVDQNENDFPTVTNATAVNGTETTTFIQDPGGFTAFVVRPAVATGITQNFTIAVTVTTPFYTVHAGTTVFADACTGGTTRTLVATGEICDGTVDPPVICPANDAGLTAPIATPAGFTFYGAATTTMTISSNGFISFNAGLADSNQFSGPLPDGLGDVNIAAYWDDLNNIVVCTKTVGATFVVQWTGMDFDGFPVETQAILDPADDSVEIVFGPSQVAGTPASNPPAFYGVSGVQDTSGTESTAIGMFTGYVVPSTSKKLTHP
jgi:hypothetical protein